MSTLGSRRSSRIRRNASWTATRYSHQKPSTPRRMSARRTRWHHAIEHASSMTARRAVTWRATVRSSRAALSAKNTASCSSRLRIAPAPARAALGEVVAQAHDRRGLVALDALIDVVGDQRVQLARAAHAALDHERATRLVGRPVADDDHAGDAHGVDHALAVAGQVAGQLAARAGAGLDGAHRASSSLPVQRALDP